MRDFEEWLKNMRISIANYEYYTDFESVYRNAEIHKQELYLLSSIIHSKTIEQDFKSLIEEYPKVLSAIPILIAKRKSVFVLDNKIEYNYDFENPNYSIDQYCEFMKRTGLFNFLQNGVNQNLYDYVTGVEVGLDSNGRKNRGGNLMEDYIESAIAECGLEYHKEMTVAKLKNAYGVQLPIKNKRFDFVVKSGNIIYGIECNFYTGGGSKLNETARSYELLHEKLKNIPNFKFIWFTDGKGWQITHNILQRAWDKMPENIYCLNEVDAGINKILK